MFDETRISLVSFSAWPMLLATSTSAASSRRTRPAQSVRVHTCIVKWRTVLCQNCVTYPQKRWGNSVIYGDTQKRIVVAW